jgi:predicted DNA-binding transcriptional regulator AlpA
MTASPPSVSTPSPEPDSSPSTLPGLISTSELLAHLGITRPTLCGWIRVLGFPRGIYCSPRRLAWKVGEVNKWLQNRPRG